MEVQLNDDGSFLVKLEADEWQSLKEIQSLFKDCSERFDEKASIIIKLDFKTEQPLQKNKSSSLNKSKKIPTLH